MENSEFDPDTGSSSIEVAWNQHRQRVLDIGYRMLGSVSDAEDVAQDVFGRLLVPDRDEINDVAGWLVTVASNGVDGGFGQAQSSDGLANNMPRRQPALELVRSAAQPNGVMCAWVIPCSDVTFGRAEPSLGYDIAV